jgi:hypothetical protein
MGKQLKILSMFSGVILYSFFISIYCGIVFTPSTHFSNINPQESFTSEIFTNGNNHAEQAESSSNACTYIARTTLKNSFNQFSFASLAIVQALNNSYAFTFYLFYSKNLFIRFNKTNIIFPFHNFW